jgi:dihydrofolate reductase
MIELPNGITLIAAIGQSGQLGLANKLPWSDKEDMKWFRQVTKTARWCIAGYNTHESLPKKIFTDEDRNFLLDDPRLTPEKFLEYWWGPVIGGEMPDKIVVIGGAKTYERWMPLARTVLLTKIDYNGPADTWMPKVWESNAVGPFDEYLSAPVQ